ncbi:MAG: glycoside hydrolase family 65 [Lachnospiraceae bacterium]|nr:glycoside hydrolase family 65 [Lachnospiraceae bacterium]
MTEIDVHSPLTVGNGDFAFTADVTGTQSLYDAYLDTAPLCTMSTWGWHSFPGGHTRDELVLTPYDYGGRTVRYASECHPGNEEVYRYLRENPHRMNLARFSLSIGGRPPDPGSISGVRQELDLWTGILTSEFDCGARRVKVTTAVDPDTDTVAFELSEGLDIAVDFPYPSPDKCASDWTRPGLQGILYHVSRNGFSFHFGLEKTDDAPGAKEVFANSRAYWERFWLCGAAVDFSPCHSPEAWELERRTILSQYLLAVNSAGATPPAETGLTCNSWYGKFHLEMPPLHLAWAPMWGKGYLLGRCLGWYHAHLPVMMQNAAANGYQGARWTKMVAPDGLDSPSAIATLLIWQQPHIIFLLELLYNESPSREFLEKHLPLVEETAAFMADFAVLDEETGTYGLLPPIIPVQEEHDPRQVKNPAFEVEYWRYGLGAACRWLERLGKPVPPKWTAVSAHMAKVAVFDGLYVAHGNCPDTFHRFCRDHPSMLLGYGWLDGERLDPAAVSATLDKVLERWDFSTLWGWDFGQLAITAAKLGRHGLAMDLLLKDTPKNRYVVSGNNYQFGRGDLPLYLPGNGALLWAVAYLCARDAFPQGWEVAWEGPNGITDQTSDRGGPHEIHGIESKNRK